jgi:hypothetical protein
MRFDVNAARKAGYTDDEIADYLSEQRGFDIGSARESGYSSREVLDFLSKPEVKKPAVANTPAYVEEPINYDDAATSMAGTPSQSNGGGVLQRIGAALRPDQNRSVLEGYKQPEAERQAEVDRRLSYGQGPISQKVAADADRVRSARGTNDQIKFTSPTYESRVRGVVDAMDERGERSFGDLAALGRDGEIQRALTQSKADEFRSAGEWAIDTASNVMQGAVSLAQMPVNLIAPDGSLAESLRQTQKELQAEESDVLKASREVLKQRVMNEEGFFGQYAATVKQLITNPTLAISEGFKQLPMFLGIVGAARGGAAAGAAGVAAAGRVAPTVALADAIGGGALTARAAAIGSTVGGGAAAVTMAAGDAAGQTYEELTDPRRTPRETWEQNPDYQRLVAEGKSPDEAINELAVAKSRMAALVAAPLGILGFMGAEAAVAGRGIVQAARDALTFKGAAKSFGKETVGEQLEEGGTQAASNFAVSTVNPNKSILEGVPEAMALAGVTSTPFGAIGALSNYQQARAQLDSGPDVAALVSRDGQTAIDDRFGDTLRPERVAAERERLERMRRLSEAQSVDEAIELANEVANAPVAPQTPAAPAAPVNAGDDPVLSNVLTSLGALSNQPGGVNVGASNQPAPTATGGPGVGGGDVLGSLVADGRNPAAGLRGGDDAGGVPSVSSQGAVVLGGGAAGGGRPVVLQNRDRSTAASISQMNSIAAAPDYLRAGPSREMVTGAPVVFGDVPDFAALGRQETVVDGRGNRVAVQYAVVDAADLIPSNRADGTPVSEYEQGAAGKLRAVAGNGRTAGLQEAYNRGTAGAYQSEMMADLPNLGVDPAAVQSMQRPVLVRVMSQDDVTPDMGDRTNTAVTQNLSPVEQAANDVRRVDVRGFEFTDAGDPTPQTVRSFVFSLPESERGNLLNADGTPTRQAVDRLMGATFRAAYGNDGLVQLYAQATDPDARSVINAAAMAAGSMSSLVGSAPEFDIRGVVSDAIGMAVNASRQGVRLADYAANTDLTTDAYAADIARFLGENIRSPKKMAEGLRAMANFAAQQQQALVSNATNAGLFGDQPTASRQEIINAVFGQANGQPQVAARNAAVAQDGGQGAQRAATDPAGAGRVSVDGAAGSQAATGRNEQGSDQQGLTSPTVDQVLQQQDRAANEAELDQRDQVRRESEAGADQFTLQAQDGRVDNTGSLFSNDREQQDEDFLRTVFGAESGQAGQSNSGGGTTNSASRLPTVEGVGSVVQMKVGQTFQIRDQGQVHQVRVVDSKSSGVSSRALDIIAKVFGKRVVFVDPGTLDVDGFVRPDDNRNIYISVRSRINPLAVLGHELTHLLKRDNPQAYAALEAVVMRELREGAGKSFSAYYGPGANTEELVSDLVGNRLMDKDFLVKLFAEIQAQNPQGAQGIIAKLAAIINRVVSRFMELSKQAGFETDALVKRVAPIQDAVRQALKEYALQQGLRPAQMEVALARAGAGLSIEGAAPVRRSPVRPASADRADLNRSLGAQRVSPRLPTAVKATENPMGNDRLQPDLDSAKRDAVVFAHNINLMAQYPNFVNVGGSVDQMAEAMITQMKDNLVWLHNQWRPELRERSRLWYVGGNRISHRMASRFRTEPWRVAAVIAATSPQKDWFQNVSLAERILEAVVNNSQMAWTAQMTETVNSRDWGGKESRDLGFTPRNEISRLQGKTLRDLYDPQNPQSLLDMAVWVRAWDETYNPRMARVISPEGKFIDEFDSTKDGRPIGLRWQSFATIAKTLDILTAPDRATVSSMIGSNHKVRSFYNNIIAPFDDEDVTIDTHAVAAALMRPLGSSATEVAHNFGTNEKGMPGPKNSAITGLFGTYPIYAEAYRRAAREVGVLPREMQSITWEAVRGLFRPEQKNERIKGEADRIWREVSEGELDVNEARQQISGLVGGIQDPAWVRSPAGSNEAARDSSYAGGVPEDGVPGRGAQPGAARGDGRDASATPASLSRGRRVAPNPDSANFKRWSGNAPLITSAAAVDHVFKTGQKVVLEGFHGTGRGDRVGTVFQRKRATSGPMAFFTSSPVLASSYAQGKPDTSRALEDNPFESWFKFKGKGMRTAVNLDRAWYFLDQESKAKIAKRMPDIRTDDDGNIVYEEGGGDLGNYDWELKQTKSAYLREGNPLKAAVESWLSSGSIYGDEGSFRQVLRLAGFPMDALDYDNPQETYPFVYKVYVSMLNPLVTSDIPKEVDDALRAAAAKDRSKAKSQFGVDSWDKNTRTLKEWVGEYLNPSNGDNRYVWTSIPDKVTEVFKSLGYDGIIDYSGKNGSTEVAPVYIPFEEGQVKSALSNSGEFDRSKKDIQASRSRERLLSMPAVPVSPLPDGMALGDLRVLASERYKAAAKLGPVRMKDDRAVLLTSVGMKKSRSHSADKRVLDLMGSIREVLGAAEPVASIPHQKENPGDSIRAWHYYGAKVDIDGEEAFAKLVVRESVNGEIYYDTDLSGVEDISGRAGDAARSKTGAAAVSADKRTLADLLGAGNLGSEVELSRGRSEIGFYSALSEGIDGIKVSAAPAAGWRDAIKGLVNKGAAKADEVEWSGVNDFLSLQAGKVTKQQVLDYLGANGVRVEEVVLGGNTALTPSEQTEMDELLDLRRRYEEGEAGVYEAADADRLEELMRKRMQDAEDVALPKYGQYTLPGGENYREVLLTLPDRRELPEGYKVKNDPDYGWMVESPEGGMVWQGRTREEAVANARSSPTVLGQKQPDKSYRSSHWDQPNVIAHIRVNDRTDADGKRVLFVEEIQSDWGQEGKKKGFAEKSPRPVRVFDRRTGAEVARFNTGREAEEFIASEDPRMDRLEYEEDQGRNSGIPSAPYVTKTEGWLNLSLKRVMIMAAEGGYDKVAFVNGEQSADRYDLSKQISKVRYEDRSIQGSGKPTLDGSPESGEFYAYDLEGNLQINRRLNDPVKELPDLIGKQLAERLLNAEPTEARGYGGGFRRREVSGVDLKVGGEGMKTFYDTIVPTALKKLLPKVGGGQMSNVDVVLQEAYERDPEGFPAKIAAQPGFDVTPEMVQKVSDGVPLFSRGRNSQIDTPEFKRWFGDWEAVMHRVFLDGPPVASVAGDTFSSDGVPLTEKVPKWYAERGFSTVDVAGIGPVSLDEKAVKNSLSHGIGRDKAAAFAVVPDVLLKGRIIHRERHDGGRDTDMVYHIAAPVRIGGRDFIADVLIREDSNIRRMYVHEVVLKEKLQQSAFKTSADAVETGVRAGAGAGAMRSVLQRVFTVNPATVSKVVDADGKPMEVYNGSPDGIEAFEEGRDAYFTSSRRLAEEYTDRRGMWLSKGANPTVTSAYLSIQNPLVIDALGKRNDNIPVPWQEWSPKVFGRLPDGAVSVEAAAKRAREMGYDGLIVRNVVDSATTDGKTKGDVFVAFSPEQIRESTGDSSDITKSSGRATSDLDLIAKRDEMGRLKFGLGSKAYSLVAEVANNVLDRVRMKPISEDLARAMLKMKVAIEQAQERTVDVAKSMSELDPAERQMISDVIEQELTAGVVPPTRVLQIAATLQGIMSEQSKELIDLGMLRQEDADRWDGRYIPRFYEQTLGKEASAWMKAVKQLFTRPRAMMGIKGNNLKSRGLWETIPADELASWTANGWEARDPAFDPATSTEVRIWRDYTRPERDGMGEIRDAMFRFVMGYQKAQRDIALGKMYRHINQTMASSVEKDGFVRVPDSSIDGVDVPSYGELAGKWVPREVLDHLSAFDSTQRNALTRFYQKALSYWKEGKVVLNPVSHANNILSNLTMAHFAGVSYWDGGKYMAALRDMVKGSPMLDEAKDAGLFVGSFNQAEIAKALPEELKLLAGKSESKAGQAVDFAFTAMTFFLRKPMNMAYEVEDQYFRYLLYRDARQRGMEPEDAVRHSQRHIFTYDDLPQGARVVRDTALPFFAYTYKVIPVLAKTALEYPHRYAMPAAILYTLNALGFAMAAGDEDDDWMEIIRKYATDADFRKKVSDLEGQERENLPPWMQGASASLGTPKAIRLGEDDKTGLPVYLDVSKIFPGGDLLDVTSNAGGLPWLQPLTPSSPVLNAAAALFFNRDPFYGKDLVDKNDTPAEAAEKRAEWAWKQFSPAITVYNYHWDRGMNVLANATGTDILGYTGRGKDGIPVDAMYAAMQTFGIKARPIDLEKSADINANKEKSIIRSIEAEISQLKRLEAKGAMTSEKAQKQIDLENEKIQRMRDKQTESVD